MFTVICRRYIKLLNQAAKNHDQRNHSSPENSLHHIQPGDIITEYFLVLQHPVCRFSEIVVSSKFCQIFPSTVLKHPYIFHLVFDSFFIILQLIDYFLRLTSLKCIDSRKSHSLEFPAFLVSLTQVLFFFYSLFLQDRQRSPFSTTHGNDFGKTAWFPRNDMLPAVVRHHRWLFALLSSWSLSPLRIHFNISIMKNACKILPEAREKTTYDRAIVFHKK